MDISKGRKGKILHRGRCFGRTMLGAPLEVFGPEDRTGMCLLLAGQHGTEPEGTVLLSSALRTIKPGELDCLVVTALNPDGLAKGTRCNANGVDLNRNFPTKNWSAEPVYYSWNNEKPGDTELSAGENPLSEPETKALLKLLNNVDHKIIISIHSPMGCVDDPFLSKTGKWLSQETGLPLVEDIGYPTPGSFGTWAKENCITLITLELPFDSIQNIRRRFTSVLSKILTGGYREFI